MKSLKSIFIVLSVIVSTQLFANTTLNLSVKGMHCGGCETKFKSTATDISGVKEVVSVSAANSNAVIVYDEKSTSSETIIQSLAEKTGYTVTATTGTAVTATGKPAGCCMSGQSNPACKDKDKAKCAKTKCAKPESAK